jgi:haloalkane dehalogenase
VEKYIEVLGSKLHYQVVGQGEPILFLHGVPTWSYLWRNILGAASKYGQAIAVDLIGYGLSDKPDIQYKPVLYT